MAGDYLNQPDSDPAHVEEIERLLRMIFPPQEVLDAISRPVSLRTSYKLAASSLRPSAQNQTACMDFAGTGYEGEIDLGVTCYYYAEQELDGNKLRVYYPEWWQGDTEKENQVGLTLDAMAKAAITYSSFSTLTIKDINLVFAILSSGTTNGVQYYFNTETQACPISMYPSAFANHSAEIFQQIVAHEVFHCLQDWSFPNTSPYGTHKWWLEGTADYFSNLVYPSANREWNRLSSFDYKSINTPIFEMSYENFIFFQFMGNRYSPEVLIDILMRVSAAGGRAAQEAALAAVQGMDVNFNRFVVEYLSTGVLDSGGKRIRSSPTNLTDTRVVESEGEVPFDVPPFVAMRYGVYYKEQKRYLQNPINNEGTQFSSVEAKHRRHIDLWSDLPPEIRSECEKEVPYLFVMTTVSNSYTRYDINVTKAEQASCDPCLLGTWDVDPIKYADMMEAVMSQGTGQEVNLLVGGHMYLQFDADGKAYTRRENFAITANGIVTTTLNGSGDGNYSADGKQLTVTNFTDTTKSVGIGFFGAPDPDPYTGPGLNEGNEAQNETVQYICKQDVLTVTLTDFGDMVFNRVEKILHTPVPTAAPPDKP